MPNVPTRLTQGLTFANQRDLLHMLPQPGDARVCYYFNDFNTYAAGDWTVTTVNSGTSALSNTLGGGLILTTGATDTNYQGNTLASTSFAISNAAAQMWFGINIALSNASTCSFVIGMTAGGPSAPTDGIYFTKAGGSTAISGVVRGSSTSTTYASLTTAQTGAMTLGFYYNGATSPNIQWFSSYGMSTASLNNPRIGGQLVKKTTDMTNLPATTTLLAPQFYLVTSSGSAAKTLTVDWMLAACDVARY